MDTHSSFSCSLAEGCSNVDLDSNMEEKCFGCKEISGSDISVELSTGLREIEISRAFYLLKAPISLALRFHN